MNTEENKKLLIAYRNNNLVLSDKVDNLLKDISDLEKVLEDISNKLKKCIEEKTYWKHKHDKKSAWFSWGYPSEEKEI